MDNKQKRKRKWIQIRDEISGRHLKLLIRKYRTIRLADINAVFPDTRHLKYKDASKKWIYVDERGGALLPPANGWDSRICYNTCFQLEDASPITEAVEGNESVCGDQVLSLRFNDGPLSDIDDTIFAHVMEMFKVDSELQTNVTNLIELVSQKLSTAPKILIGGSTIEGAMLARFFKPLREIEFDLNYLIAHLPKGKNDLVENIEGKIGKVRVKFCDDLLSSISKGDRVWLEHCKHNGYLNTYKVKQQLSTFIRFKEEENWIKAVLAIVFNEDTDAISFENATGGYTKATTAWAMRVKVGDTVWCDTSMDLAFMMQVDWWPDVATEWKTRPREWPDQSVIEEITTNSYIIAKPSHDEKDNLECVEGSNSFHAVEAHLAHLRSDNQRIIYLVFKAIMYKFLKPIDSDKIQSFWIKNAMLWHTEWFGKKKEYWSYLVWTLRELLQYLLTCVRKKTLDYFFIPDVNIMEILPDDDKCKTIEETLERIIQDVPTYLKELDVDTMNGIAFYREKSERCKEMHELLTSIIDHKIDVDKYLDRQKELDIIRKRLGIPTSSTDTSKLWNIGTCIGNFIGREDDIKTIHYILSTSSQQLVIYGHGGIGKSELALSYCHANGNAYQAINWLNAESSFTLKNAIQHWAVEKCGQKADMEMDELVDMVYTHYAGQKTLFVLDNVENEQQIIELTSNSNASKKSSIYFLLTSQHAKWCSNVAKYELKPFTEELAVQFIEQNIPPQLFEVKSSKEVACKLEYSTLALQLCVSYLKRSDVSTCQYLIHIDETCQQMQSKEFHPATGKSLNASFNIAVDHLKKNEDEIIVNLAHTLAYLDGKKMEVGLLKHFAAVDMKQAWELVTQYSLLQKKEDEEGNIFYTMHGMIQNVLKNEKTSCIYVAKVLKMVESLKRSITNKYHMSYGDEWIHHLTHIYKEHYTKPNIMNMMKVPIRKAVDALIKSARYNLADEVLTLKVNYETSIGDQRAATTTKAWIAKNMQTMGKYEVALNMHREIYEVRRATLGLTHPRQLMTKSHIASCMQDTGDYLRALQVHQEIHLIRETTLGPRHPETIKSKSNIGYCMQNTGDYLGALQVHQETRSIQETTLGPRHPDTLTTKHNTGYCMLKLGDNAAALNIFIEVVNEQTVVLGPDHPTTIKAKQWAEDLENLM